VAAYYHPHESNKHSLAEFKRSVEKLCNHTNSHIWIGGDFNMPGYDWLKDTIKPQCNQPELTRQFLDTLADNSLSQVVRKPSFFENYLDLFLVSNPSAVCNVQVIPGISADGHHAVFCEMDVTPIRHPQKPRKIQLFSKADWEGLRSHMSSFATSFNRQFDEGSPVNTMWSAFKGELHSAMDKYIPTKMARSKDKAPWVTPELRKLLKKQTKLFHKQRGSAKASRASQHYRALKSLVQRTTRQAYWKYVNSIISDNGDSEGAKADTPKGNKRFWTFIKHKKQEARGVAPLRQNGKLVHNTQQKATVLNEQFQSVFNKSTPLGLKHICQKALNFCTPDNGAKPQEQMASFTITGEGVVTLLKKLKPFKAAGPDMLRPLILKELATEIEPVLTTIFNASLMQQTVPDDWKTANVSPIFKKGEKYRPENYRPVSLTCICSKLMEHVMASQLMSHLDQHRILYRLQHGFRARLSCETQLLEFANDIFKSLTDNRQSDVIIMDFSKAFDKVSHSHLLYKLRRYGATDNFCGWTHSFLSGRSQQVVIDGEASDPIPVTSGVPQGSVLGPILFLVYINDMATYTKHSTLRLFADDTLIYMAIHNRDDCSKLQEDITALGAWEKEWLMEFHPDKCNVLRISKKRSHVNFPYTLHNRVLAESDNAKYLGVTVNSKMNWNIHIDQLTAKSNKRLGFIKRNLKIPNQQLKSLAYKTLVRPTVEYACTVWDPHTLTAATQLEKVQRRAARWVMCDYRRESSVTKMLQTLNWRLLALRRVDTRLYLMYKILNNMVGIASSAHPRMQRDMIHLQPIHTKQEYYKFSFFPRTITDWNNLDAKALTAPSLQAFRACVCRLDHNLPYAF
jgi:hypothetical protein